ncbi:hypothetical protein CQW23_07981 [Capsicum baccatum]|uniref:Uncharacterized protein n=1 Tax=Capsicum baccatum TaxID=33114 RepID=A0A2G2X7W1_CAPBA|nr:hypothetical protein CQW23_07981 [Capsicum baccatum]
MVDDTTSSTPFLSGTIVGTQSSTVTTLPSPSLAHQLPLKLTSSIFLLRKTQFLPMVRGCGLGHHINGSQVILNKFLSDQQPNPNYHVWLREDQLVLSWIVASVFEGILPQLVGAETSQTAWNKLVVVYASVEFVLAGLGPAYRPFTRSLEARQEDISFDALYELLLNEE